MHKWLFASRFRRNAFGWKSQPPIQRIKEALSEIKLIARSQPVLAAEGAVLFIEKLSPSLEQVDGSSGAIGAAVNRAIEVLVPLIAAAEVDQDTRKKWLERLWAAVEADEIPYIESIIEFWGELCGSPAIASVNADIFLPTVIYMWSQRPDARSYYKGTGACLSCLFSAGRHDELLALLEKAPFKWWGERRWGVKSLLALGRKSEAVQYAEDSRGLNAPVAAIAAACEEILLDLGNSEDAYKRYALLANIRTTNLGTYRAIAKKYSDKSPSEILDNLVASQPGSEGKWFAAAKDAGLFDYAISLAVRSPADPETLIRASKEFRESQPAFAYAAGMLALKFLLQGLGFDITYSDVTDAFDAVIAAAEISGTDTSLVRQEIISLIDAPSANSVFVKKSLARYLEISARSSA